jgi:hypothetical protein
MKKKLRRGDLPNATDGLADRRRKREFRALLRTSVPAYVTKRFKQKKGSMKRFFPTPYGESRLRRAARFQSVWIASVGGLTDSAPS